jgi:hypothetical protein
MKYKLKITRIVFETEIDAPNEQVAWDKLGNIADQNAICSGDEDFYFSVEEIEDGEDTDES